MRSLPLFLCQQRPASDWKAQLLNNFWCCWSQVILSHSSGAECEPCLVSKCLLILYSFNTEIFSLQTVQTAVPLIQLGSPLIWICTIFIKTFVYCSLTKTQQFITKFSLNNVNRLDFNCQYHCRNETRFPNNKLRRRICQITLMQCFPLRLLFYLFYYQPINNTHIIIHWNRNSVNIMFTAANISHSIWNFPNKRDFCVWPLFSWSMILRV